MAEPRCFDRPYMLLVFAALLCSGCGSPPPPRIGIVLDQDGQRGATLAAADINAAGGIHGQPLQLRILSGLSGTQAPVALAAAESLSNDPNILGVVGHINSNASLAAAQVYNARHVVQIAPTTTAPLYSDAGPYSFRLVPSDLHQGAYLADLALAEARVPRTAVLYVNDDYGRGLRDAFVTSLAARGVRPVYDAPFAEGEGFTDVEYVARALARSHPDLLVWLGRTPELRLLLPQVHAIDPHVRVVAGDGLGGSPLALDSVAALDGVRYVRFLAPASFAPAIQRLREQFAQRWHGELTDQFVLAYEAVQVLAEAIRVAGPDRVEIERYVADLGTRRPPFPAAAGPIAFDERGDPPGRYFLAEVRANRSRPVRVARRTVP